MEGLRYSDIWDRGSEIVFLFHPPTIVMVGLPFTQVCMYTCKGRRGGERGDRKGSQSVDTVSFLVLSVLRLAH